ncbi:hypothetical protein EJB05_25933 [Eragrostis curvula]|uniref:Uncharacterized protein n=1 Tax=Eragrostis curvula TaxID=38414 RepID=A0A5J9UIE3_9POAL|nr:hypothetical protein EJB05_25933 [Eragrostis curvula]
MHDVSSPAGWRRRAATGYSSNSCSSNGRGVRNVLAMDAFVEAAGQQVSLQLIGLKAVALPASAGEEDGFVPVAIPPIHALQLPGDARWVGRAHNVLDEMLLLLAAYPSFAPLHTTTIIGEHCLLIKSVKRVRSELRACIFLMFEIGLCSGVTKVLC